mmetsp:Transcript_22151/g.33483  ORF Transcript_22151/g.33483 Transcript_22151/m.33483 type:complete len:249 (+) Transcript_22151:85-831(+)
MDRFQISEVASTIFSRLFETLPKTINSVLVAMGFCNICLVISVLHASMIPNLGISPSFLSFLLCVQNALTWFALNSHRISHLPTLSPDLFMIGCLLGISVGGSIVSFILSRFYGRMSKCVRIEMSNISYTCNHEGAMTGLWFWSGLVFWFNAFLSVLLVRARDLASFHQQEYENLSLGIDEIPSELQHNTVFSPTSGDGTFFGKSSEQHEAVGDAQFPTTPSQEITAGTQIKYGAETGFDDRKNSSAP